ncbi:flagellar hook-associated protein FlgK [Sporosarcina luteola]|uniref:flagellar hook-associated protein FlgK n=1 Tax=Sporosarcina luteola TaxID=582850 RepID=UPI00203DBE9B|nr:flagellar hook-associated protein FlgK [Sporosarcina luteola]MCM3711670.1 flagellar hook-associated protein FlgK [Sporosarcina luteola]
MRSTFMGLETNKRGLYAQQSGLYTTGNNISNANTLGYTRQRVNMQATTGLASQPGLLGTGVQASSIQRIRDSFVDNQFRQESNKLGYWESRSKAISQLEDIVGEPSEYGLQKSLSEFWSSLQNLSTNPSDSGARAVVVQRGQNVAEAFNHIHSSLTEAQANVGKEISFATKNINSLLKQIGDMNGEISRVEASGYLPNELYDQRDLLLDELSTYLPIETTYEKNGGNASSISEGMVTVSLKLKDGNKIELVKGKEPSGTDSMDPIKLIYSEKNLIQGIKINVAGEIKATDETDETDEVAESVISHSDFLNSGKLKSLMDSYGTADGNGLYPEMINDLNKMAKAFAFKFNEAHIDGVDLDNTQGKPFFIAKENEEITAGNISVYQSIIDDPRKIAASNSVGEIGNAENVKDLLETLSFPMNDLKVIIGTLGASGQQAERMAINTATLQGAASNRRDSISSISLDEEMTDMIRFQQAYNASARMITVIDETLDKIINGMGIAGR